MPEPMMPPTTAIVASKDPRARRSTGKFTWMTGYLQGKGQRAEVSGRREERGNREAASPDLFPSSSFALLPPFALCPLPCLSFRYRPVMARGWESKSVEAQQADREDAKAAQPTLSAADVARLDRRRSLLLARARLEADLAKVLRPAHRATLEAALRGLDAEMAALDVPPRAAE